MDDRPQTRDHAQMSLELFEQLATDAERGEEGLRFEFLGGKLGVQPMPDSVHAAMVSWLVRQCMQQKPHWDLMTGLGLKVETYREGRAVPDGALVPEDHFLGGPGVAWAEPDGVLMTVEVTSYDRDTNQRDRIDKPRAYAEAGIPVFLLIGCDSGDVTVHSKPVDGRYRDRHTVAFGEKVALPEPVGMHVDTQRLVDLGQSGRG
ncbi:Uma2 family endonuclease [Actinacidiphila rubida]|uniref:Uma2 family endonuclease n=1 Tax=Actinacidiphila rubida TaxID=310780 RepID=UPI002B002238|nr:Uma2 family endonuclease [Actinacidiphila rubida]